MANNLFVAHSENGFLRRAEYFPLFFSLAAPVLLIAALWARDFAAGPSVWRVLGFVR